MDAGFIIGFVVAGAIIWCVVFKMLYDRVVQKEAFVQNGWFAK